MLSPDAQQTYGKIQHSHEQLFGKEGDFFSCICEQLIVQRCLRECGEAKAPDEGEKMMLYAQCDPENQ